MALGAHWASHLVRPGAGGLNGSRAEELLRSLAGSVLGVAMMHLDLSR